MNSVANSSFDEMAPVNSFIELLNATAAFREDVSHMENSSNNHNTVKTITQNKSKLNTSVSTTQTKNRVSDNDNSNIVSSNISSQIHFIDVDGPVTDDESSIIRYDVPFSRSQPIRSLRLRKRLMQTEKGQQQQTNEYQYEEQECRYNAATTAATIRAQQSLESHDSNTIINNDTNESNVNVRFILDRVIAPRRWRDKTTQVIWEQHASPLPASRIDTLRTEELFERKMTEQHIKNIGICPKRTLLLAECFLELIRQVVVENWEQGLLLLHVYREYVAAQIAHRALFESRVGHAFRLALKASKDVTLVNNEMRTLRNKIEELTREEAELRQKCDAFASYAEEQTLIAEKQHADAMVALRREHFIKKNQLERMVVIPPNMEGNEAVPKKKKRKVSNL